MVTLTENNTAKIPDGAEVNDQYKKDKFDIDGGKAVRLEGLHRQGNMAYITRVNGVPLLISEDGIEVESDVHYTISSSLVVKQTTIEEAFGYLHGDYEAKVKDKCLGCSETFGVREEKPCSCPVGSVTDGVEYPEVEPRQARIVVDGKAFSRSSPEDGSDQ